MPVGLIQGNSPLIVTMPYTGVNMPRMLINRLEDQSRFFSAPDRFLARLLGGRAETANILQANFHRFVSDVDYVPPARATGPTNGMMGTVPILDDRGMSIWSDPPGMKEAASWRAMYYAPFHAALATQVAKVRARFGHAIIFNLRARHTPHRSKATGAQGTLSFASGIGTSCGTDLSLRLSSLLKTYDNVAIDIDRNVRRGRISRHYGKPSACCHAIDADIDEAFYLTGSDDAVLYDAHKATPVAGVLEEVIACLDQWCPN